MNHKYHVIGVMSGTSLDGIDLVKCLVFKNEKWNYKLEKYKTVNYNKYWKNILSNAHNESGKNLTNIHEEYGEFIGNEILNFIKKENIQCDYISSHGHTIFHEPEKGKTLQIGCGKTISQITNITTICNFRQLDISLDGQGAPLVPIGDVLFFKEYELYLNLGGFANITIKDKKKISAFDICPVNYVLNFLSKVKNKEFDYNGEMASEGFLQYDLLEELNNLNFYQKDPPKSLSREWVEKYIFPILKKYNYSIEDKIRTFCEHISIQISQYIKNDKILITGGGAHNKFLIKRLRNITKKELNLRSINLINYKEAIVFCLIGVLAIRSEINCLSSVTGASRDSCCGDIYIK
ncbi:MAG: anhydro-N-acetylmuramic acid kinase [Flavobacteriales bacterium]|nr:anhydro-N-acetylmuramic acid kinase [Flavobacteriales bacterium]